MISPCQSLNSLLDNLIFFCVKFVSHLVSFHFLASFDETDGKKLCFFFRSCTRCRKFCWKSHLVTILFAEMYTQYGCSPRKKEWILVRYFFCQDCNLYFIMTHEGISLLCKKTPNLQENDMRIHPERIRFTYIAFFRWFVTSLDSQESPVSHLLHIWSWSSFP